MTRALTMLALAVLPCAAAAPALAQDLDIDAVFNCSADGPIGDQTPEQCLAARDLLLNNCTSCHSFVPIVKAQKDEAAWTSLLAAHRERVLHLSEDEFRILGDFLRSHYNETEPVPVLPPALEALSTNQPA
jgi:hypothetical protein